jgi:hypothetical protein
MGKLSRTKGHSFEREVASQLREIYPNARRGLQYRDGSECCDVEGTPFHIETKRGRKPNPRAALAQAITDAKIGRMPIAVIRDDREEAFAVMLWTDLLELLRENEERGEK